MNVQGWIEPGSEEDRTLASLRSAIDHMMDPKYRETFIAEAKLSELIAIIRDETKELLAYLVKIESEAEARTNMDEFERIIDRIGGFA